MRRPELMLVGLLAIALLLAVVLGQRAAPNQDLSDTRPSTYLSGPRGAKALAQALRGLGDSVEQRQQSFFDLAQDSTAIPTSTTLAFLDVGQPTDPELDAITRFVERGGRVIVTGSTGVEYCLGYDIARADTTDRFAAAHLRPPNRGQRLPRVRYVLVEAPDDTTAADSADSGDTGDDVAGCELLEAKEVDTLLTTTSGAAVALDLYFDGGGRATLISDPTLLSNRSLKETDAGVVVLPWLLDDVSRVIVFDEYHQGFGVEGSLAAAAWRWTRSAPAGWVILQCAAVALFALAVAAVRFGPALPGVERRRRSPLEHVTALASGLERAEGRGTAIRLLTQGLRRRLSRGGPRARPVRGRDDLTVWLKSLALATNSRDAQVAVKRLENLTLQRGGDDQVLAAALAVEDVWEALGPKDRHNTR